MQFSDRQRILVVAAHPDDEILGCGGIMSRCVESGGAVRILLLGEGSSCRFRMMDDQGIEAAIAQRRSAATSAGALLGLTDVIFGKLPCGRFHTVPRVEVNHVIEDHLRDFRPSTVLFHSSSDVNSDHKIVHESALMAVRPVADNLHIKTIATFEIQSSSEWNTEDPFRPNLFVPLSEDLLSRKIEAMACYATETRPYPFPRSNDGIRAHAMYRGMQVGHSYAEAFRVTRSVAE